LSRRPAIEPVTRQRIIKVAAEYMAKQGYRGTNLGDIADHLNVTRQALYYHFTDKQAILEAIFETLLNNIFSSAEGLEDVADDARFRAMFGAYIDVILADTAVAGVAVTEPRELRPKERARILDRRRQYFDSLEAAYAAGVAAGSLIDVPPRVAVRIAIGAVNWATQWYRSEGAGSRAQVREYIEAIIFQGASVTS
jgi:AcrR family transcriptional regulator